MNDKEKKAYKTIVENASPYIELSYVIDAEGNLLATFHFHPQVDDECMITLDKISSDGKQIMLTPDDIRSFAENLLEFAATAETVVESYNKKLNETHSL